MENKEVNRADQMRLHIETCSKSGMTVSDYCVQQGLAKSCYYYWHKKLKVKMEPAGFVPVSLESSLPAAAIEVIYPNGVRICFSGVANSALLKELVCCM